VLDRDFGPGFIKLCSYFPDPAKVWAGGHEWAKRQATTAGVAFTELANGFASCDDPAALQAICDRLGPADLQRFFDRWLARIPTPLGLADQAAGYWWELSMRQVEVSRTLVLDAPRQARAFFPGAGGRQPSILAAPTRSSSSSAAASAKTPEAVSPPRSSPAAWRSPSTSSTSTPASSSTSSKGRALRVETVVNSPTDLGCQRRLRNLDQLQAKARAANRRLLTIQRVGQGCATQTALLARISQPSLQEGQRTGALRLGILASWPWPAPYASC
jgi:cell division septation protein DedD